MNRAWKLKMMLRLTTSVVVGLSPALLSEQAAFAQAPDSGGIEEVVVTARKREESMQKVPVAVTAISGDQLKAQMITKVSNLQNVAPGLIIAKGIDDPQNIVLTLRGRKQVDAILAVDSAVGINVDGLYVPRSIGLAGSLLDLERVEVLRGPQGTLYGRNTTGGAIGIFSKDPTHELSGSIDVTGGNYGTWSVLGILNAPLTDTLDARFVVQHGGNGGYDHNSSGTPLGDARNEYYRAKLKWTGNDNWTAVLSTHFEHDRSGGVRGFLTPGSVGPTWGGAVAAEAFLDAGITDPAVLESWSAQKSPWYLLDNTHGPKADSIVEKWDVGLTITGDLTDALQVRSITGVQRLAQSLEGGPQQAIFVYKQHPHTRETYYSQELQLLGSTPRLNWVVGAYAALEKGSDGQVIFFLPQVFGTMAPETLTDATYTTAAAFAQATWEFIPDWHVTGGARYTSDSRHITSFTRLIDLYDPSVQICLVPAPGGIADPSDPLTYNPQCGRTFKAQFQKPTWLISLDHQVTSTVLAYAKVGTGYRSGGVNAGQGTIVEEAFGPFRPETNLEYEVGIKTDLFNRRVRLNAAAYWDEYSNLQEKTLTLASNGTIITLVTSASKSRVKGVEVEAVVLVGEGLTLQGAAAFTEANYRSFVDALGDHTDRPFDIPKWTVNGGVNYTRPTGLGDVSIQVDYAWKSSTNIIPYAPAFDYPEVTQKAYGLLNARVNLHIDAWNADIAVFGQNLTDEFYFDQGFNVAALDFGFDFNELFVGGAPRTWGVQLVKKFGQ